MKNYTILQSLCSVRVFPLYKPVSNECIISGFQNHSHWFRTRVFAFITSPQPGAKDKKKLGNEPSEEANRSFGKSTNNSYIKLKTSSRHTPSERVPETHAKLYCCIMTEIRCLRKTLERSSKVATRNLLPNSFKKVSVSGPQLP